MVDASNGVKRLQSQGGIFERIAGHLGSIGLHEAV